LIEDAVARSPEETESAGRRLAGGLTATDVVYLLGGLGAGKTCFARGLASGLGASPREVASPTFAIVHEDAAPGGGLVLRHLDLYRIPDVVPELEALGIPETLAGVPVAVEWPGEAMRKLLAPTVEVTLERMADGARRITIRRTPPDN
jgi:tRNA threonylcarbamoyladenosine biosynthesis protein TsaE